MMRDVPITILAILAHPDDEIGAGSTLAYYSDAGVFTVLATASRGEAATIYCDDCATRENLADVRTHELECACRNLGIAELRWFDWPDGGIGALPRDRAIGTVVALIRQIQPDIILTHPENGLYPHPDHLAMWEIVRAAYDAAADPGQYSQTGEPWAAARLYTRAIPQSYFDAAPEFATYRVELNGSQLPFYGTPDAEIDVTMRVAEWSPRRMAAWECHRSQINPDGAFSRMPDGMRQEMAEIEHFVLAASRVPLTPGIKNDLLAGLDDEGTEGGEPDPARLPANSLNVRRAYMAIYEEYLRQNPKVEFQALVRALQDKEQEMVYLLAGALRRADAAVSRIEPNSRLVRQSLTGRSEDARAQFLQAGARHAAALYGERAARAGDEQERSLWGDLQGLVQQQLETIQAYLKQPVGG